MDQDNVRTIFLNVHRGLFKQTWRKFLNRTPAQRTSHRWPFAWSLFKARSTSSVFIDFVFLFLYTWLLLLFSCFIFLYFPLPS
jgi:hypothetical protein